MALILRDVLSWWYPNEDENEIEVRANEIVEALWDGGVRAMAMAEAKDDGLVMIDPEGREVTITKLENYLNRPPGDVRRLV
jgi:hypothetical protein